MANQWVRCTGGRLPSGAVQGGTDQGGAIFIARAGHLGSLIPGKFHYNYKMTYIGFGGKEHATSEFEVFVGSGAVWESAQDGRVPPGAVLAGNEANGDPLYVARAKVDGSHSIGKINPKTHNVCHVPYGGKEHLVRNYQVLVCRPAIQTSRAAPRHQWVTCSGGGVPSAVLEGAVQGGRDNGTPIYVARMCHPETGLMYPVPGKYHPNYKTAYVCSRGKEQEKGTGFELLVGAQFEWMVVTAGNIPENAVVASRAADGTPLHVARAKVGNQDSIGMTKQGLPHCLVPFGGKEHIIRSYEVLVTTFMPADLSSHAQNNREEDDLAEAIQRSLVISVPESPAPPSVNSTPTNS